MQELEQRSRGMWRPSPGSIYPALQQLEDEGLVKEESSGTGRTFELTKEGRAYAKEHADELDAPWESVAGAGPDHEESHEMFDLVRQIGMALMQVVQAGSAEQVSAAKKILIATRRSLYQILAGDEDADDDA